MLFCYLHLAICLKIPVIANEETLSYGLHTNWEEFLTQEQVIWQYPGYGAHATYTLSKKHSNFYFNSDCIQSVLQEISTELFHSIEEKLAIKPDWIVSYAPYGTDLGRSLAKLFQCKFTQIQSLNHPEFTDEILACDTVLFCADDFHTGGSFLKVRAAVSKVGAKLLDPLVVIANFNGSRMFEGHEIIALIHKSIQTWDADTCPLCSIGSEPLSARLYSKQLIFQ